MAVVGVPVPRGGASVTLLVPGAAEAPPPPPVKTERKLPVISGLLSKVTGETP